MSYTKKTWVSKELITTNAMNNIETGIENAHKDVESLTTEVNKKLTKPTEEGTSIYFSFTYANASTVAKDSSLLKPALRSN